MSESDHVNRSGTGPEAPESAPQGGRESRPEPERQGPDRTLPPLRDRLGTGSKTRSRASGGAPIGTAKSVEQVVAETVRAGYEVIEENIRHGRHAAERLRQGTYRSSDLPGDLGRVMNRLISLGMDLSTTWFQLVAAILRDPRLATAFEGTDAAGVPAPRAAPRRTPRIIYRVRCSRPNEIEFNPQDLSQPAIPAVAGLHLLDRDAPPIQVRFDSDRESGVLAVVIDVQDAQPPGTYNGAVVDRDTHQPIGTLRLKIEP